MKPKEIKETLEKLGTNTRKSLGQHFLIDEKVLGDIMNTADIKKDEVILEIGPGLGVLTKELVEKGAKVIAIEKDKKFVEYLTKIAQKNLRMVQGDAAKLDWDKLTPKKWKLIANLPYAITSFVLRKALTAKHPPEKIVVLIQKEVAERAVAKNGKQSLLSLMIALNSESARIVRRVWKGAFFPPPKVESAILEIIPFSVSARKQHWKIDTEKVMKIAKIGFAHPRKKLVSNLKSEYPEIQGFFEEMGLSENVRAQELRASQWVDLALLTAS